MFLGSRPGEDLSVLGEVDLWMEKWIALVLQDSYKLLELWWIIHFYSSESLTVCNMCLTHWNHLMSTLTTNPSEVFTSRKFQMHLQLLPKFLHQDAPQAFPTQDILNRILSSKTWSFFTLHLSCLRWKAQIILNVTLSPNPHPTGHQALSSLSDKYFVIHSLIPTILGQAFMINSLNWFLKNFSRSLSLFFTIFFHPNLISEIQVWLHHSVIAILSFSQMFLGKIQHFWTHGSIGPPQSGYRYIYLRQMI